MSSDSAMPAPGPRNSSPHRCRRSRNQRGSSGHDLHPLGRVMVRERACCLAVVDDLDGAASAPCRLRVGGAGERRQLVCDLARDPGGEGGGGGDQDRPRPRPRLAGGDQVGGDQLRVGVVVGDDHDSAIDRTGIGGEDAALSLLELHVADPEYALDAVDRLRSELKRRKAADATDPVDLGRAAQRHGRHQQGRGVAVGLAEADGHAANAGADGGDHPSLGAGQHETARPCPRKADPDRADRDVSDAGARSGKPVGLEVGERRSLRGGKPPRAFLDEPEIGQRRRRHPIDAALDLTGAKPYRTDRPGERPLEQGVVAAASDGVQSRVDVIRKIATAVVLKVGGRCRAHDYVVKGNHIV